MNHTDANEIELQQIRKRRRGLCFVLVVFSVAAIIGFLVLDRMQNKIHLIDVTQLDSITVLDQLGGTEVSVLPQLWTGLLDNFESSQVNLSPGKLTEIATITIRPKTGDATVIHVYNSGQPLGCFRIGKTYYSGGDERKLVRIIDDQRKRDLRAKSQEQEL